MNEYISITVHPDVWNKLQKTEESANAVVSINPWQHGNFTIGKAKVVGRKAWQAREAVWSRKITYYNTKKSPLKQYLDTIVIHHTNNTKSIATVEEDQGFAALGYHFFIDQTGKIFEGRPLEILGSHAGLNKYGIKGELKDPDWGAIGVVLQGDYHCSDSWLASGEDKCKNQLNTTLKKQFVALKELLLGLKDQYQISTLLNHNDVIRKGTKPWYSLLQSSAKLQPTVCPGDLVSSTIIQLRNEIFP